MWEPSAREGDGAVGKEDKEQVDSQLDSGFLSGSNLLSSELSIDPDDDDRTHEPVAAPESPKPLLDLGVDSALGELSLKEKPLIPLDSGVIIDEDEADPEAPQVEEKALEPYELYYTQDNEGDTQLHISVIQGFIEAVHYLIRIAPHPCLFDIKNDDCQTALHLAVLTHQPRMVQLLVLAGADLLVRDFKGNTPLHVACSTRDVPCAAAITNFGKRIPQLSQNLEQRNYVGETCLHIATSSGDLEMVRLLVQSGADVNSREGLRGCTPLHLAIEKSRHDIANCLISEGKPNFETTTYGGVSALKLSRRLGKTEFAELIISKLGSAAEFLSDDETDSDEDEEDSEDEEVEEQSEQAYRAALIKIGMNPVAVA